MYAGVLLLRRVVPLVFSVIGFTTLSIGQTLATITNLPATSVAATTATLSGQVLSTGADTNGPNVSIYYGTIDGGTNASAWAGSVPLGAQNGGFSHTVGGLATNITYHFTAKAVNAAGASWASPSLTFSTLPISTLAAALTYHCDNTRQGQNTNEFFLTPGNVNSTTF